MHPELKELGFSDNEIKIYLTILKSHGMIVARINELTGIPRPTIYDTLNSLIEKGIRLPFDLFLAWYHKLYL